MQYFAGFYKENNEMPMNLNYSKVLVFALNHHYMFDFFSFQSEQEFISEEQIRREEKAEAIRLQVKHEICHFYLQDLIKKTFNW